MNKENIFWGELKVKGHGTINYVVEPKGAPNDWNKTQALTFNSPPTLTGTLEHRYTLPWQLPRHGRVAKIVEN